MGRLINVNDEGEDVRYRLTLDVSPPVGVSDSDWLIKIMGQISSLIERADGSLWVNADGSPMVSVGKVTMRRLN